MTEHAHKLYDPQDDPNAELIGFRYTTAQGTPGQEDVEVLGTVTWSKGQYVLVQFPTGHCTIKPAAFVARHRILVGRDDD